MAYPNRPYTVDIDATGEVAQYQIITGGTPRRVKTVSLNISGSEAASYQVEFGEMDAESGEIEWYDPSEYAYTSTTSVHDGWVQSETYLRILVTGAATAGATASISVSSGE